MKRMAFILLTLGTLHLRTEAQTTSPEEADGPIPWSYGAEINFYFLEEEVYTLPIVTADHHHLHLEARYNYEDVQTISLFAGYNLETNGKVSLLLTPMLGTAFGNTTGLIPAVEATVSWSNLEWYMETEWLIDPGDSGNNFLYTWSDLTYSLFDHLYVGLSAQRTRVDETGLEIERGLVAGYYNDRLNLSAYTYNIATTDFFLLINVGVSF